MKLFEDFFLDIRDPGSFGRGREDVAVAHKALGHALVSRGAHEAPFDIIPHL